MQEPTTAGLIDAFASLLRAIAWPCVAGVAMYRFTPELRSLLQRIREGAGAKFDPPPQSSAAAPSLPSTGASLSAAAVPFQKTPSIQQWEKIIDEMPALKGVTDTSHRAEILRNVMARLVLSYQFDGTEATIYASQLSLLTRLSLSANGEPLDTLREMFFETARKQFPDLYANYSFEGYLQYLSQRMLVTIESSRVLIADMGREYLAWRKEAQRAPRVMG